MTRLTPTLPRTYKIFRESILALDSRVKCEKWKRPTEETVDQNLQLNTFEITKDLHRIENMTN